MSRNFLRRALRNLGGLPAVELGEELGDGGADAGDGLGLVALGAAAGLGDDAVDDAEGERSWAVRRRASAASFIFSASFHRIEAQPSGEITE